MKEKKLNTNNSKKLIIGVSILFCTVILIIGATTAFFTQSDNKEIRNIVTTDINGTLLFDDNNDYMFGNLIPVNEEDVIKFASKDTDICKYQDDMYACNMYEFTITNDSNVTQELKITLNPIKNEFGNLHYMLFESNKDNINTDMMSVNKEQIVETNTNIMVDKLLLGSKQSKTYTVVYYVLNLKDTDQTSMDANKQFYASVRVDSITTGTYAGTLMESRCYEYEEITDGDYVGTYKLTKFNGINHDTGEEDITCGVTKNGEYYSVNIPSKLKNEEGMELNVSTLGNKLFIGIDLITGNLNYNIYINNIIFEEGIEVIEDAESIYFGSFSYIGYDVEENAFSSTNFLNVVLPSTLKNIGNASFMGTSLKEIVIPKSVKTIGDGSFFVGFNFQKITFEGADDNTSSLESIGMGAFAQCNLNYSESDPLLIPENVRFIGENVFYTEQLNHNKNLKAIKYTGDYLNYFHIEWYDKEYIKLITE